MYQNYSNSRRGVENYDNTKHPQVGHLHVDRTTLSRGLVIIGNTRMLYVTIDLKSKLVFFDSDGTSLLTISPMRTAGPAAGATDAFHELGARPLDSMTSRFRFLGGCNPANPLVARERGDIVPCRFCGQG